MSKQKEDTKATIYYHDIGDYLSREKKLSIVAKYGSFTHMPMQTLAPNDHGDWLSLRNDNFGSFIALEPEKKFDVLTPTFFNTYAIGVASNRDAWVYNFSGKLIDEMMYSFIKFYNNQVASFQKKYASNPKIEVEDVVDADPKKISWTRALRRDVKNNIHHSYNAKEKIPSMYRPFIKQHLYFHRPFIESPGLSSILFPSKEFKNLQISLTGSGASKDFTVIMTNVVTNLDMVEKCQCFVNSFKAVFVNHSKRISDYFEMSCFNLIVQYYRRNKYKIKVENLQGGRYRYKCSTAGNQPNFSNFYVYKKIGTKYYRFEIYHNLAVQSCHHEELFTTPDIAVVKRKSVKFTTDYYDIRRALYYVSNKDLITFCEAKNFNPFPELLFNFIGTVNELRSSILSNTAPELKPAHIAPSLMVSGKPNKPAAKIKEELEKRYAINIFYDLFYTSVSTFYLSSLKKIRTTGALEKEMVEEPKPEREKFIPLEELPF